MKVMRNNNEEPIYTLSVLAKDVKLRVLTEAAGGLKDAFWAV